MVEMEDLLYVIPANSEKKEIVRLLQAHPEIKFVSLVGIDLAGNDTDEKIPMRIFLKDMDDFYNGTAVQTDGSIPRRIGSSTTIWSISMRRRASQSAPCAFRPSSSTTASASIRAPS